MCAQQLVRENLHGDGATGGEPRLIAELKMNTAEDARYPSLLGRRGEARERSRLRARRRVRRQSEGNGVVAEVTREHLGSRRAEDAVPRPVLGIRADATSPRSPGLPRLISRRGSRSLAPRPQFGPAETLMARNITRIDIQFPMQ